MLAAGLGWQQWREPSKAPGMLRMQAMGSGETK